MHEKTLTSAASPPQEKESRKHAAAIVKLAEELAIPHEDVKKTYEEILELFEHASIQDYVSIFVSRCVKERLKEGGLAH